MEIVFRPIICPIVTTQLASYTIVVTPHYSFLLIPLNRVPMTCSGRKKKISSNSEAGISHQTNARKRIPDAAPFLKALIVVSIANCVRWSI